MAQFADILDVATLDLRPGEGRSLDVRVRTQPVTLAGERYEIEHDAIDARIDVSRTVSGYAMHLHFQAHLLGTCMRCLGDAAPIVEVDAREIDQPGEVEELHSPYLEQGRLDLGGWARDALMLALPPRLLCRAECCGLCAVCGANLNDANPEEHRHDSGDDSRWAKLREWGPAP